jgi:hypothetical protein
MLHSRDLRAQDAAATTMNKHSQEFSHAVNDVTTKPKSANVYSKN